LIDTQADSARYSPKQARHGIDLLCENALAAALACADSGMDVRIGYSGGGAVRRFASGSTAADLAALLAWPAALPLADNTPQTRSAELPAVPEDCGILILALPRTNTEGSALNRFLKKQEAGGNKKQNAEVIFIQFY
jgi:hypothetical protein